MKTSWKDEVVTLLMIAAMFAIAAGMWSHVPDRLPVHWTLFGEVNRFGGRFEGLLGLPLMALGLYVLLLALPRIDPRRAHYAAFAGPYRVLRAITVGSLLALELFKLIALARPDASPRAAVPAILAVVCIALGNYLPKIQSNWFVGVRTPWTLSSEESWRRTHRLAGWMLVAGGAVTIVVALAWPAAGLPALLTTVAAVAITSVVYSYFVWRHDPSRAAPSDLE